MFFGHNSNVFSGYGGQSPVKKLKESNSMELCNSKLATEIANYKTYYQKSLSENERLQQTLDVKDKDFKATVDELEQLKKQYKMMKLTNDNLNADIGILRSYINFYLKILKII